MEPDHFLLHHRYQSKTKGFPQTYNLFGFGGRGPETYHNYIKTKFLKYHKGMPFQKAGCVSEHVLSLIYSLELRARQSICRSDIMPNKGNMLNATEDAPAAIPGQGGPQGEGSWRAGFDVRVDDSI